jgi:hypothetical protein
MSESDLVNSVAAAEYLKMSPGTLAVWRCEKRYNLRYVRVGRKILYRIADLERFIESRTDSGVESTPGRRRRA